MNLVERKGQKVFCDSSMVARKFKMKHKRVIDKIQEISSHLEDFQGDNFVPLTLTEKRFYQGQEYTAYLMNRDFFMLLIPKFNTKASREWQGKFLGQFNRMEKALLTAKINRETELWVLERESKKKERKELTDVIQELVDYGRWCDSKNSKHYFNLITNLIYRVAGIPKSCRDCLSTEQLATVAFLESHAAEHMENCIANGTPYKKIYGQLRTYLEGLDYKRLI